MSENLKLGISLLVLTSIFFLCVAVALFFIKESEREKRSFLEAKLNETLELKIDIEKSMEELKLINKDLEAKLSSAHLEIKSLAEDYAKEKEARQAVMAELDNQKKEVKKLIDDIMEEKEQRVDLVQKLARAEEEYRHLKAQMQMVIKAKEVLEKKVKGIISQDGVELEKIVVQPGTSVPDIEVPQVSAFENPYPEYEQQNLVMGGEVLIVNKKFDFVIVNIGKSDGLNSGDSIEIHRNSEFLAEAQVEKLYDRMSAATILPPYRKVNIRPGDKILISR